MRQRIPTIVVAYLALATLGSAADITTAVDVKKNAVQQLAYARRIAAAIPLQPDEPSRRDVALHAVTALRAIAEKWPNERKTIVEAALLESDVFAGQLMLQNALQALEGARKAAPSPELAARLLAHKGSLYRRLAKYAEASATLETAAAHQGFGSLDPVEQLGIFSDLADAESHLSRHSEASAHLRRAAALSIHPVPKLALLLRSVEANERGGRAAEVRADLDALDDVIYDARKQLLGPGDTTALEAAVAQTKRHRDRQGRP